MIFLPPRSSQQDPTKKKKKKKGSTPNLYNPTSYSWMTGAEKCEKVEEKQNSRENNSNLKKQNNQELNVSSTAGGAGACSREVDVDDEEDVLSTISNGFHVEYEPGAKPRPIGTVHYETENYDNIAYMGFHKQNNFS